MKNIGGFFMNYYRKIIGKQLYLSPVSVNEEDFEKYMTWMNNKDVAICFGQYNRIVSSKNELKWLYEPPSDMQRYAIILIDSDILIGSISIHNIDHLNRNAFIRIFIGDIEQRGKGYGTEAIRLIFEYGFKTLNLYNISLTVHADNYEAIACYKKVGFRETGRMQEWVFKDGQYIDKIYMGLLVHEFENDKSRDVV